MRIPLSAIGRSLLVWLCFPSNRQVVLFLSLFFIGIHLANAEGSKDFVGYQGYRMFLDTRDTQQMKVYANVGEFLNIGSSHLGIHDGFIQVYRPDGTLAATYTEISGSTKGIIYNNVQEMAGPTGGGTTNGPGYQPNVIEILPGQAGVWTVYFGYPSYQPVDFQNILNGANWTRAANQPNTPRVILAWDITVSKTSAGNNGGILQKGRVFTNEYVSVINQNGFTTSPTFYVLTKGGFIFEVSFKDADPFRFPISSNSSGFLQSNLQPVYMSQERQMVQRSITPNTWTPSSYYLYEPQAQDYNNGQIVNNKIFFNPPSSDLPATALTTDIFRENPHNGWLYVQPSNLIVNIDDFKLTAVTASGIPCDQGYLQTDLGGTIAFTTSVGGTATLMLDLNNDGDFTDPVDRVIFQQVNPGTSTIIWDGKDGHGANLPPAVDYIMNYNLSVRGGETHILLTDVENNYGGVTISLFNNIPVNNPDVFYYDHSQIGGPVSGNGTPGNPNPTTIPFTYQNNFGNNKILDYWTFFEYDGDGSGTLIFTIVDNCTPGNPNPPQGNDHDNDGILDWTDIDDDNDGVPDAKEYCNAVGGGFSCLPGGKDPSHDEDGDGIPNYMDANDPAIPHPCTDSNVDGICDFLSPIFDTDLDGVPDHLDLDSDNDGITDLVEAGHGQPDANGNGIIDGPPAIFGLNGLYNPISSHPDALNASETYVRWDVDADGVPDHDDLDADNDGINDVAEAGYALADLNNNGRIGNNSTPIVNMHGLVTMIDPDVTGNPIPLPPDWDNDGIPDWHDLDSDNDLIHDVEEAGKADPDNDAIVGSGVPVVNVDGQAVGLNLPTSHPPDTDGDAVPDWHDLDTDNDGINDVREANGTDPDNDGHPGVGTPQVNAKGMPTSDNTGAALTTTSKPADTDSDLVRDYRDLDSDNDGINDVAETNLPDPDGNGMVGSGSPAVNTNGQTTAAAPTSEPTDTDGDGIPDFRQLDSDGDGINDVIEANLPDPDFDGIIGNGNPAVNSSGQASSFPPTSDPTDTDGDGTPDFQELDADDDGIFDAEECFGMPCLDLDQDGFADFQDVDRDGDGIVDSYECETGFPCPDTDGDGIWDVDDLDTDGDGLLDIDECPTGAPCVDANGNGIPEWREFFCNPNVTVAEITNLSGGGTFCQGASTMLSANNSVDVAGSTVTYQWVGPNGFNFTETAHENGPFSLSITNIGPQHSGTYTLYLFTEEGCVGNPGTQVVTVNQTPATPVLSASSPVFCFGETLELNSTIYSGSTVDYLWFYNGGNGPSLLGITNVPTFFVNNLTGSNAGTYSLQVSQNGCASLESNAKSVTVNNTYSQTPSLDVDDDLVCAGQTLELNSAIINAGGAFVEYEWWFNNGSGPVSIATTDVPTLFIENTNNTNTGIYNVSVNVGNCQSQLSNSQDVVVDFTLENVLPYLNIDEDLLCEGQTLELNSTAYGGANVEYQWFFDDGSGSGLNWMATTNLPTFFLENVLAANAGNYSVMITNGLCGSQFSNLQDVEVNNDLSYIAPQLSVNDDLFCEGETLELNCGPIAGQNIQYQWYLNNGNGPALIGQSTIPTWYVEDMSSVNEGIYTVRLTMGLCLTQASNAQDIEVTDELTTFTPMLSVLDDSPCEGQTIELNSSVVTGSDVTYVWIFDNGTGPVMLDTTDVPTLFIANSTLDDSGVYTVMAAVGNCQSQASNAMDVDVTDDLNTVTPTLMVNNNLICEGEMLELNSSIVTGANVTYEWFFENGSGLVSLGVSNAPSFFIQNVTLGNNGFYSVAVSEGNCTTQLSNTQYVEITDALADVTPTLEVNSETLCNGETLELNSSIVTGGSVTYEWFFNDGSGMVSLGTTNVPTFFIGNVTDANIGIYEVTVSIGNCTSQPSNAESVAVGNTLDMAPMLSLNSDVLCEGQMLELNSTSVPGNNVMYNWYFNDGSSNLLLATTDLPTFFIPNVGIEEYGVYTVTASVGNCTSQPSNAQDVTVQAAPALDISNPTDADNVACPGDFIDLGVMMVPGASYLWTGPAGFSSAVPNPFIENISPAQAGDYYVMVTLGGCSFMSQASTVFVYDKVTAGDDYFEIEHGETVTTADLLVNDKAGNADNWSLEIVTSPVNGTITQTGNEIVYTPRSGFGGNDDFTYRMCNDDCPDQCDEAVVQVRVASNGEDAPCFVPNIITPNEDGANDYFRVPCLESQFSDNSVQIFNRFGDLVYQAQPYKNDWNGTFQGNPLPPGTYFYLLKLDVKKEDCLQGYFTITR